MSKIKKVLSNILGIDESEINDESSPDTIENWDSFNGLMLVSELENEFKIRFTTKEIISIKNVADIKKALIKHGIKPNEL